MSGQVLYAKNPDLPRPPASTTKIMTAILLLENTLPDDIITASKRASETEGSSLNMKPGEKVTAHDLLYALMLRSANDGCVAVAEHIAGSESRFAEMMTEKAREIGAVSTTFRNANGLNTPPNVTTARDLATMARYASAHFPEFDAATRTKWYKIQRSGNTRDILLRNHARFLWKFPGADGIKTGYTNPAGHCFVGGATWNGWRLISVVMNSPDTIGETGRLMKWGFQQFEPHRAVKQGQICAQVPVRDGQLHTIDASAQDTVQFVVPKGAPADVTLHPIVEPITAPIPLGAPVGTLEAWVNGLKVGSTPLLATMSVERAPVMTAGFLGGRWVYWTLLGAGLFWYGRAYTKASRRRRYRLQALMRGIDRRG